MPATELRRATKLIDADARRIIVQNYPVTRDDLLLAEIIDSVVLSHGDATSVAAADWYDTNRAANGVRGNYAAEALVTPKTGAHSLVGWANSVALTEASMQELILGGVTKRIFNAGRSTIMGNSTADSYADGWQRSARSRGCGFCKMLADEGRVYRTEWTAAFAAHDSCGCSAVPAWRGRPRPVRTYTPGARRQQILDNPKLSDEQRTAQLQTLKNDAARAREWIAMNAKALST